MISHSETAVEIEVLEESDGLTYVFRGPDEAHVDELIELWAQHGEPTWVLVRKDTDVVGFGLGDLVAATAG